MRFTKPSILVSVLALLESTPVVCDSSSKSPPLIVKNYQEIENNYAELTQDNSTVFYMSDSETFLVRPEHQPSTENLDKVGNSWVFSFSWLNNIRKPEEDWIEYDVLLKHKMEYPGVIPVSACQSQEYGGSGSISFSYTLTDNIGVEPMIENTLKIGLSNYYIAYDHKAQRTWGQTSSVGGSVSCSVNEGQISQVWMKPYFVEMVPKLRKVKYKLKKFITDPDFKSFASMYMLVESTHNLVSCATGDVVELFCENSMIGIPDWDNPLQVHWVNGGMDK